MSCANKQNTTKGRTKRSWPKKKVWYIGQFIKQRTRYMHMGSKSGSKWFGALFLNCSQHQGPAKKILMPLTTTKIKPDLNTNGGLGETANSAICNELCDYVVLQRFKSLTQRKLASHLTKASLIFTQIGKIDKLQRGKRPCAKNNRNWSPLFLGRVS